MGRKKPSWDTGCRTQDTGLDIGQWKFDIGLNPANYVNLADPVNFLKNAGKSVRSVSIR